MADTTTGDIAIAHEHYPERGGGEHVADQLARTFDAPVWTGYARDSARSDDVVTRELFGSGISGQLLKRRYPGKPIVRDLYYQFAWAKAPPLYEYDTIIQSGNNPTWWVPRDDQTVIKYVHSPPRTPYDLWHHHTDSGLVQSLYAKAARMTYPQTASYVDTWVANSELVARRIHQYLDRHATVEVVYPPVDVTQYDPDAAETDDYYLTLSRLTTEKRNSKIVKAVRRYNQSHRDSVQLRIAGSGPERDHIESLAKGDPGIDVLGYVSEQRKRELLAGARALITNAKNEDFGMTPIEAAASGTPTLGVSDGYTQYQIVDGQNGLLYDYDSDGVGVTEAIKAHETEGVTWSDTRLRSWAERWFSTQRFAQEMRRIVSDTQADQRITVPWADTDRAEQDETPAATARSQ